MTQHLTIRGLPRGFARNLAKGIAQQAWPVDDTVISKGPPPPVRSSSTTAGGLRPGLAVLPVLIFLGDLLLWGHAPGLSLAVFAGLIFAASCGLRRDRSKTILPAIRLAASALPVIEYPQILSFAILLVGLAASLAWLDLSTPASILRGASRRLLCLPIAGPVDAFSFFRSAQLPTVDGARLNRAIKGWALPIGGTLLPSSLLMSSNPVLDGYAIRLDRLDIDPARLLFWIGIALMVRPFLTPTPAIGSVSDWSLPSRPAVLNGPAVARALVVFNLVMGVQTAMDIAYPWSGAALPDGVTLATYAHRGAYPLLVRRFWPGFSPLRHGPFWTTDCCALSS